MVFSSRPNRRFNSFTGVLEVNMKHARPALVVGLVAGVFVATAVAQKATIEFDQAVDFTKFKTFAIREGTLRVGPPGVNAALNSELTKKRIEDDIERAFTARRLTKAIGAADVNVVFTLGTRPVAETEAVPAGPRGRGTGVINIPRLEGNLSVELIDPTTRSLVWHAVVTEVEPDAAKLSKKLDDMVKKAIDKYPPRKVKGQK